MDTYSRIIQFLKVVLPLMALALLSTVFLLSRGVDPEATIPFAEQDLADRTRDQQVTAPFFSGTTKDGDEITVTAALARPGGPGSPAEAEDLNARIRLIGGREIRLTSDLGSLSLDSDLATFTGNVVITSSDGMRVTTAELTAAISGVSGHAPGQVDGTGPIGAFTAGALELGPKTRGGPVHMLFKDGVKLIYDPGQKER